MAKVTIEFNTDDMDDNLKMQRMMKADDCFSAIWDILQKLRARYKYPENYSNEEDELESIREDIQIILDDHGINMDKLYS